MVLSNELWRSRSLRRASRSASFDGADWPLCSRTPVSSKSSRIAQLSMPSISVGPSSAPPEPGTSSSSYAASMPIGKPKMDVVRSIGLMPPTGKACQPPMNRNIEDRRTQNTSIWSFALRRHSATAAEGLRRAVGGAAKACPLPERACS